MFIKNISYFVAALVLMHLPAAPASPAITTGMTRIVGGQPTTIESVPYLVQIWKGADFVCAGSLVSELFVVTAAHCLVGSEASDITAVGGASHFADAGERRGVALIIIHPRFVNNKRKLDVALMKLDSEMTGTDIHPIGLNTVALVRGQVMHVSGWGLQSEHASNPSGEVRQMFVPILPRAKCVARYRGIMRIAKTMFCAAKPGVQDHCFGDTGGPAVCNGKLCGIISTSVGCARVSHPGVYIGVRAVGNFIRKAMLN